MGGLFVLNNHKQQFKIIYNEKDFFTLIPYRRSGYDLKL